jgi:putative membrane protein
MDNLKNHIMKRIIYTIAALYCLSFMTACNSNNSHNNEETKTVDSTAGMFHKDSVEKAQATNDDKKMDSDESKFLTETASGGMFEVELGKIAEERAQSPAVKKLAGHMVKDHSKLNEELKGLAAKKQITISSSMADKHKEDMESVAKKTGTDFDKEYVDEMVKAHKKDLKQLHAIAKTMKLKNGHKNHCLP